MIYQVNGGVCLIDEEDFEYLDQFSWHFDTNGYVKTTVWNKEKKTNITLRMHQLLIGKQEGMLIDHINNNKADNRRSNLRHLTYRDNWFNSSRAEYFFHKGRLKDIPTYLRMRSTV